MDGTSAVDFNGLFDVIRTDYSRLQPFSNGKGAGLPQQDKSPCTGHTQPQNSIPEARTRLQREADRRKAEREQYQRANTAYQEAIRNAGTLRSDIIRGIQQGEDPRPLLMIACECIALQTGDSTFFNQAEENIRSIYGYALGNPYPLQQELSDTRERLDRIIQAEAQAEEGAQKRRLQGAIREHRKKIQQIEKSLRK